MWSRTLRVIWIQAVGLDGAPHEERLGEEEAAKEMEQEQLVRRREVWAHSTYEGSNAVAAAEEGETEQRVSLLGGW